MNIQNKLGIWISKPEHLHHVDTVISKYNSNLDDIFLICDSQISSDKYAIVSSYYISFDDIMIAFLSVEDLIMHKDFMRSKRLSLFCNSYEILQSKLDKSFFKNIMVVEI